MATNNVRNLIGSVILVFGMAWGLVALSQDVAQAQSCGTCPPAATCTCVNCGFCNSGQFSVGCNCVNQPGKVHCAVSGGDCHQCAKCVTTTSDQTCTVYVGCGGCPSGGCVGNGLLSASVPVGERRTIVQGIAGAPEYEFHSSAGVPIEVTEISSTGNGKLSGIRVSNKNNRAGLVTLITAMTFVNDENGDKITVYHEGDSWGHDRSFLPPGEMKELPVTSTVQGPRIDRVFLQPVYAEFDDGTTVGAVDARPCLTERRRKMLKTLSDVRTVAETGTPEDFELALQASGLSWLQLTRARAEEIQRGSGREAVRRELQRPRRLQP